MATNNRVGKLKGLVSALGSRIRFLPGLALHDDPEADRLASVLPAWRIKRYRLRGKLGHSAATSWLVTADGRAYVLRRARCERAYLEFQLSVIRRLIASDFPYEVPVIIETDAGADYVVDGECQWLLYSFLEGNDAAAPSTTTRAGEVGALVAHYDRVMGASGLKGAGEPFPLALFDTDTVRHALTEKVPRAGEHHGGSSLAKALAEHAEYVLRTYGRITASTISEVAALERLAVYNDWHRYNRVVRSGKTCGLIDFDSVMQAPRIVDFQNALTFVLRSTRHPDENLVSAFSKGYQRILPLTPLECRLIYPVMLDRVLWLLADIVEERDRVGETPREELAVQLMRVAVWLCGTGERLGEVLSRDSIR